MKDCQSENFEQVWQIVIDNDEIGGDYDDDGGVGRDRGCDDDNDEDDDGDDNGDGGDDDDNLTPSQNVMQDCQSESYPAHWTDHIWTSDDINIKASSHQHNHHKHHHQHHHKHHHCHQYLHIFQHIAISQKMVLKKVAETIIFHLVSLL